VSFKKRAPRAIKEIKAFAEKAMVCTYFFTAVVRTGVVLRWSEGKLLFLTSYQFYIQTLYDFVLISFRAPRMSASTRSSTRKSGNPASRAFPFGCVCASRESVTTRRVPRRSYTATCRQSTSRTPRAYTPLLLRIRR
jgi:Ribosomal protein L31e